HPRERHRPRRTDRENDRARSRPGALGKRTLINWLTVHGPSRCRVTFRRRDRLDDGISILLARSSDPVCPTPATEPRRVSILRQTRRRLQLLLGSCRALGFRLTSKRREETAGHPQGVYELQTGPLRESPHLLLRNSVRITWKL